MGPDQTSLERTAGPERVPPSQHHKAVSHADPSPRCQHSTWQVVGSLRKATATRVPKLTRNYRRGHRLQSLSRPHKSITPRALQVKTTHPPVFLGLRHSQFQGGDRLETYSHPHHLCAESSTSNNWRKRGRGGGTPTWG